MKKQFLVKGLLALTVVSVMTGCVDDKYDLTDIDTTSRFTVDDLTVPVNLDKLTLKNVIDIKEDDETIKTEIVNGEEIYAIKKGGEIEPKEFTLDPISVTPDDIEGVKITLSALPSGNVPALSESIPLTPFLSDKLKEYNFEFTDIDGTIKSIDQVATSLVTIKVILSIPSGIATGNNKVSFKNLSLVLPKELMGVECVEGTYDKTTNKLSIPNLPVESDGKATLVITASGLELNAKIENQYLKISGEIGLESADINFDVANVTFPNSFDINISYSVSQFNVEKFTGSIDYRMDDIKINPIKLDGLPDFLNDPKTNIIIDNPAIYVKIENPVGNYGGKGHGTINLVSKFSDGNGEPLHGDFVLEGNDSKIAFCSKEGFVPAADYSDYKPVVIEGLDRILTNGASGLPEEIVVSVTNLIFDGQITNIPLTNIGAASGNYNFYAPLAFGDGSVIYYNTTENGWSSEDLDAVNITHIKLHALCTSKLPVDIELKVKPIDKNGNIIDVKEADPFKVPANCTNELATLTIEGKDGKPITGFDGVIFEAIIKQTSPDSEALGPNIELDLNDLRVTVDGYYEKKF